LVHLQDEVPRAPQYRLMPGVESLLARLSTEKRFLLGLGTGNIEQGARIKLARGDLNRHFAFGGFGSDAEDRADLLRAGVRRAAQTVNVDPTACSVVVIGDTTRDVEAAHTIGAPCIAVATGTQDLATLRAAGPAIALGTLEDTDVLAALHDLTA
ncbi:MAG: HAD hydrolase-like protein, partial [Myxococcales bacterium]|nr:HAD hydrolase-like protein [Myxococcales bacterium]